VTETTFSTIMSTQTEYCNYFYTSTLRGHLIKKRVKQSYHNYLYRSQFHFPNFPQFLDISEVVFVESV